MSQLQGSFPGATLPVRINIPQTRILDDHAEYGIVVTVGSESQLQIQQQRVSWRRFRDFEGLRGFLSHSGLRGLAHMPPKYSWWTSRSAAVVDDRQKQLEFLLRDMERRIPRGSNSWNTFCQFIGIDSASTVDPHNISGASISSIQLKQEADDDDVLSRLHDENVRLKTSMVLLEEEEQRLREELARKEGELQTLKEKKSESRQAKEQTQSQIAALERERNTLKVELARLETVASSSRDVHEELRSLKTENATLRTNVSASENEKSDLKASLARLEESYEGLKREFARLQEDLEAKQAEIKILKDDASNSNLVNELARVKKERGDLELEVARLETAQQSAAAYGANVLAKIEKAEKDRAELSAKLLTVTQQLAQATATIEAEGKIASFMRERVQELEKDLRSATQEMNRLSAELDHANEGAENLTNAHERLKRDMEEKKAELAMLQKDLNTAKDELAVKSRELDSLKLSPTESVRFADDGNDLQVMKSRLEESELMRKQYDEIKRKLALRVDELNRENEQLKASNQKLQKRVAALE